ncbi:IS1182 family transposase [Stenotrophomonas sp. ATs4]|uniref:IS1182 family transposase n=1 Tax=Stenotrophomonas sp. ATs4 TaxID=3402766 RepID=UPI003F706C5B
MRYVSGQDRDQTALFPLSLEELVPADHPCRVIEAFVGMLDLAELGFTHAQLGRTGRPPHNPADLLKLYLYGYLNQVRSSRRLERECQRNVELMWLLGRLAPDHKTIANFRRQNGVALQRAGAGLVRFCQQAGLVKGQWVAVDGSKFQAVASSKAAVRAAEVEPKLARLDERIAHYLAQLDVADTQESDPPIDRSKVQQALEQLRQRRQVLVETSQKLVAQKRTHLVTSEPDARVMRGVGPGYNLQTAVDGGSAMIVAHALIDEAADNRQLQPMAEAAAQALQRQTLDVLADAGYSNGAHAHALEQAGIVAHVPANRGVNNQGEGDLLDRTAFTYNAEADVMTCPEGHTLQRKQLYRRDNTVIYQAREQDCGSCPLKPGCTPASRRLVSRHLHEDALQRMHQRATPEAMKRRRCTVEHPFAGLKYRIFGHPRLLMRGLAGAAAEMAIATTVWNLKRAMALLGAGELSRKLAI